MLAEARHDDDIPMRPAKRRRPGEGRRTETDTPKAKEMHDDLFGDDLLPAPTLQTMERDSDDDDSDSDGDDEIDFEEVPIQSAVPSATAAGQASGDLLDLDLSAHMASVLPRRPDRRKALTREEKARRVQIHKVHLVCLMAHVEIRNRWCNDPAVHDALRPLLPQKTVGALIPRASLNQFGRAESLKKGLQEAKELFKLKFAITERGMWKALWAEDEEQLKNVCRSRLVPSPGWLIIPRS
jgi:xeroderma pigmentosum group C-complementing protein